MAKIPVAGVKPEPTEPQSIIVCGETDNDWRQNVREIVGPIWFDRRGTHFFDADGKMIAQIRGWGGLTSSGLSDLEAIEIQTKWGVLIETAVNEYLQRRESEICTTKKN